jgi:hypothetical protein
MAHELVPVYEGFTLADAEMLADRLNQAGIEAFIDNTDSPFDGTTSPLQSQTVRVVPRAFTEAREIVRQFEEDGHEGLPLNPEATEEAGSPISSIGEHPSDDSPANINDHDRIMGERLMDAESAEVEGLRIEDREAHGQDVSGAAIRSFGVDRDIAQDENEAREAGRDQSADDESTGHPAADTRGKRGRKAPRRSGKTPRGL